MESHSPSADRIGAALRALRRTHADEPGGMAALSLKCLQAVVAELAAEGVAPEDLQPLADLQGRLARRVSDSAGSASGPGAAPTPSAAPTGTKRDRRHGTPPSPTLLARAAVIIDLLVRSGQDEAEAAQTVMRRLMGPACLHRREAATRGAGGVSWNTAIPSCMAGEPTTPSLSTGLSRARSRRFRRPNGSVVCSMTASGIAAASLAGLNRYLSCLLRLFEGCLSLSPM